MKIDLINKVKDLFGMRTYIEFTFDSSSVNAIIVIKQEISVEGAKSTANPPLATSDESFV